MRLAWQEPKAAHGPLFEIDAFCTTALTTAVIMTPLFLRVLIQLTLLQF